MIRLGVNVDHVATLRQARGTSYPDPILAAREAVKGGAAQITIHLREDRRHIQEEDLRRMRRELSCELNLEMAASDEIVSIACETRPDTATLVPEKRLELTTEGGLDVVSNAHHLSRVTLRLRHAGIRVSMFIDPELAQVEACAAMKIPAVELHTGVYCDAKSLAALSAEGERLKVAARRAKALGLIVCAGHGINYENARELSAALPEVVEYNIGHAIVARAIFAGMEHAVSEMKALLTESKHEA